MSRRSSVRQPIDMIQLSKPVLSVAVAVLGLSGCGGDASGPFDTSVGGSTTPAGSGGTAVVGQGGQGVGGAIGNGGATSTGGATGKGGSVVGSGGATSSGGASATGGAQNLGGSATGGKATGGAQSLGGSATGGTASGGAQNLGGSATGGKASGGAPSTGGLVNGGAPATGGVNATGGKATGGAIATGGSATGGAVATGGTTAVGGSSCGVAPVSPNATAQAKNLLCYLYSIYKSKVLSGQQETNWNANPTDIDWYVTNVGKYPAVLGSDFMYRDGVSCSSVTPSTQRAIAYWNAGGIPMFRYHMGLPGAGLTCTADCYQGSNCSEPTNTTPNAAFFTNLVTSGTAENTSLNAKLDYVAVQLAAMQAANVPVLLALFHEAQSNGWFWWSMTSNGTAFVNLWKYAFNYLTATKGLKNIVWLMPFSGNPSTAFYPGKAYVDVGGPDQYTQPSNIATFNASANWSPSVNVLGTSMPITMHETGSCLQPDSMFPNYPWVLWSVWATYQTNATYNTTAAIKAAYASSYTITRDEIPSLK